MLAKSHSSSSKKARVAKRPPTQQGQVPIHYESYNKADDTVSAVYVDIANGASRSDCLQKIEGGLYGNKPVKRRQATYIYNAALDRFAVDCDVEAEKLRNLFYGRYEALLEEAIRKGDIYNAKGILDSMSRIFGVERKGPDTQVNIQNNAEGIKISFGFNSAEEQKDEE